MRRAAPLLLVAVALAAPASAYGQVIGRAPSSVSGVLALSDEHGATFCSAVLVERRLALTAAHCLGKPRRLEVRAEGGAVARVARATVHPHYDDPALENDLAALVLDRDIGSALPIGRTPAADAVVDIVGFAATTPDGATRRTQTTGTMEIAEVQPLELVATARGSTACHGDSGGAVLAGGALVAIVSRGPRECDGPVRLTRLDVHQGFVEGAGARAPSSCSTSPPSSRSWRFAAVLGAIVAVALASRKCRRGEEEGA